MRGIQAEGQTIIGGAKGLLEDSGGFFCLDWREVQRASNHGFPVIMGVNALNTMYEGSKYLQGPWHSLHVQRAGKDGEVGGSPKCHICSGKAFLVIIQIAPFPANCVDFGLLLEQL